MRKTMDIGAGRKVMLTDSADEARFLQSKVPVIGIVIPGQEQSWAGVLFVAEGWEGADREYAELAYCRYYGIAKVIIEDAKDGWRIREAAAKDARDFLELYEDAGVKRYIEYPLRERTADLQQWRDWIESLCRYVYPLEEPAMWVLADGSDCMMGRIGLEWKDTKPSGYYLGYALLPQYRKKGLAARAASRLLVYCMEYWGLDRIWLECDSSNIASVKTAKTLGFEHVIEHQLDFCPGVSTRHLFVFTGK